MTHETDGDRRARVEEIRRKGGLEFTSEADFAFLLSEIEHVRAEARFWRGEADRLIEMRTADRAEAEELRGRLEAWKANSDEWQDSAETLERDLATAQARVAELEGALRAITDRYCDLAGSGDAGHWDYNNEDEVKRARAALRAPEQKDGGG